MIAQSSEDRTWTCTACGGAYAIVGSRERASVRLKCIDCGSTEEAVLTHRSPDAWLLIDPDGKISFATSRRELVEMETGAHVRGRAASLLAGAAPFDPRKTMGYAPEETPRAPDADATPIAPSPLEAMATPDELPSTELQDAPPSVKDIPAGVAADAAKDTDPEPSDVTAFASPAESERLVPAQLAKQAEEAEGEKVSLRDVVVVKDTPPPPAAGTLKTLPPMGRPSAPPPPTIDVASAATKAKASSTPPPAAARESMRPSQAPEAKSRVSTYLTVAAMVGAAWIGARAFADGGARPAAATAEPAPPATVVETPATTVTTPAAVAPAASSSATIVATAPAASSAPAATPRAAPSADVLATPKLADTASDAPKPAAAAPPGEGMLPVPQLLERAGAARRAGNLDKARELYTQVLKDKPGDVEASSGLGEVSRMSGDLAGAREHYKAALQSSPSFYPALLGLADVTWDAGDKTEAARLYDKILSMRDNVPDRVRDRAGATKPAPKAADEPTE